MRDIKKDIEFLKKAVAKLMTAVDLEEGVRPEYLEKLKKIDKEGKFIGFSSVDELRESIENAQI